MSCVDCPINRFIVVFHFDWELFLKAVRKCDVRALHTEYRHFRSVFMHVGFGMFLTVIVCVSLSLLSCLPCMLIFYAFTLNVTGSNTCQLLLKTVNVSIALLHRDGAEKSDKAPAYLMAVGGHAVKSVDPLASLAKQLGGSKRNALLKWCQNRTATYTVCIEIYHTTPHSMMIVHRGHVAWTSV